jgi:D-serine deaminase-like pyridoxal phosphate-dependent protein
VIAREQSIGRPLDAVPTPALVLDRAAMRANVATMADWAAGHVAIRPHFKTHKALPIAHEQLAAGAIGITCATVWEARCLVDAGVEEILVANQVVGAAKLAELARLATRARLIVAVDDVGQADALSAAMTAAGARLGVLVEADVGLHRGGCRSVEESLAVAAAVEEHDALDLRGAMGYEGHVVTEPDPDVRRAGAARAMGVLRDHVDALRARGHAMEIVSAGGTNTHAMTGADPLVTEIQAGTYAVMDRAYAGLSPTFRSALLLLATVVSRHGERAVLDCGVKAMSVDLGLPDASFGTVHEVHEEHTLLDVPADTPLRPGDRVALSVVYCGGTINLHDAYYVVNGQTVVDVWEIGARGPGAVSRAPTTG